MNMSESRLFVGNLAYQIVEKDLRDYFSQAGQVSSVSGLIDKYTGRSRGFAFIVSCRFLRHPRERAALGRMNT